MVPWFYIGSVEAFERNLENAQNELQIPQQQFLDVIYKQENSYITYLFNISFLNKNLIIF